MTEGSTLQSLGAAAEPASSAEAAVDFAALPVVREGRRREVALLACPYGTHQEKAENRTRLQVSVFLTKQVVVAGGSRAQ